MIRVLGCSRNILICQFDLHFSEGARLQALNFCLTLKENACISD